MRRIVCALLLAANLAACGGGDGDGDAAGSTSTSTSTTGPEAPVPSDAGAPQPPPTDPSPPTTQDLAADQALAESIVLRAGDAPAGWTASAPDGDDDSGYDRRYAECVGVPVEHVNPGFPEAEGQELSSPDDNLEVSASATVAPAVESAQPLLAAYRDPETPTCFTEVLREVLVDAMADSGGPPDLTVEQPTFEPLPYPILGEDTVAFRLRMTMRGGGVEVVLWADAILVRSGRVALEALFTSLFEPFPVAESERLLRVMANRIPPGA